MSKVIRILFVAVLFAGLALPLASVGAQGGSRTRVITEAQINESYRVTNPARRAISNVVVDLQPGQVVISSTHTYPNATYDVVSVWTPSVSSGRVTWQAISITANGQPSSQELIDQVNASILTSWRNYWRNQNPGRVQSIVISDNEITVTRTGR
jgi:hypothetical protein